MTLIIQGTKNPAVFHRIKSHLLSKHNVTQVIEESEFKFIQNKSYTLLNTCTCISIFILLKLSMMCLVSDFAV